MRYAIQVNSTAAQSSMPDTACQFTKTLLEEGHDVIRVFFYQDGILNGFEPGAGAAATALPPDGSHWSDLARIYGLDLVVCTAASERRGHASAAGLLPGFRPGGLSLWMEACLTADRFVVFEA